MSHPSRPESLTLLLGILHQLFNLLQCLWEEGFSWDVLNSLSIVVELIFRYTENLDKEKKFNSIYIYILPLSLDLWYSQEEERARKLSLLLLVPT